jgi:geranylgeranyl diphosphate synthase type II
MTISGKRYDEAKCRQRVAELATMVNAYLPTVVSNSGAIPKTLATAIDYSLSAGGKRLRPVLALAAYGSMGRDPGEIIGPAAAIELIHTYSLIHDDLPCMDDDDFRRGRPTLHKEFNEALAVLAGDALHALAFELLASTGSSSVVLEMAKAIGVSGMIAGQVADVESEGQIIDLERVEYIHRHKTAALIEVSLRIGAILAGADHRQLALFSSYGSKLGLAFQIVDDVLDITGSQDKLGKDVGSDIRNDKATYPSVVGLEKSRRIASELVEGAREDIVRIGPGCDVFLYIADFVIERES